MKDTFFFSHDFSARNDPKLQEVLATYGVAGIGIYWCIIEQLYEQGGELPLKVRKTIAFILHCDVAMVESIVDDFGLFDNDGEVFWSESAKKRIDKMAESSARRRAAGAKRWEGAKQMQCKSNANAMQEQCSSNAIHNKIKENKINNNNSLSLSLSHESDKSEEQKERDERDLFYEIFFYKNFQHPDKEVERFIAHYSAVGWCRNNGQAITDKTAVAQLWEQADKNALPRFPQPFLDTIKAVQSAIDSPVDQIELLRGIRRVELLSGDMVRIVCRRRTAELIESVVSVIKTTPFMRGRTLIYGVINET